MFYNIFIVLAIYLVIILGVLHTATVIHMAWKINHISFTFMFSLHPVILASYSSKFHFKTEFSKNYDFPLFTSRAEH